MGNLRVDIHEDGRVTITTALTDDEVLRALASQDVRRLLASMLVDSTAGVLQRFVSALGQPTKG